MKRQFEENTGVLSQTDFQRLQELKVVLVGLGGIGGNIASGLVRLGVEHLVLVDFDTFEESNINRQLFANHHTINQYKVDVLEQELKHINPNVEIKTIRKRIQDVSGFTLNEMDIIIDAVDQPESKIYLEELSDRLQIPLLHGACAGWYGQVAWLAPGSTILKEMYMDDQHGLEKELRNPVFAPSMTASVMLAELVKWVQDESKITYGKLQFIDLFNNEFLSSMKEEK